MSERVLIVDDEVLIQWFIEKAVTNWGYHADTVSSVAEAIKCLETKDYDVLITDIIMPGTNGLDLISKVKESYKNIGVIACSAFFSTNLLDELDKADVLTLKKPFRQQELKAYLDRALNKIDVPA